MRETCQLLQCEDQWHCGSEGSVIHNNKLYLTIPSHIDASPEAKFIPVVFSQDSPYHHHFYHTEIKKNYQAQCHVLEILVTHINTRTPTKIALKCLIIILLKCHTQVG